MCLDFGAGQWAMLSKQGPCFVGPGRELGTWGEVWDGSVAARVSPPAGPAWTQKTLRHTWAGTSEARHPWGCFRHLGRDPRAKRAQESTAKKKVGGGEIQESCPSLADRRGMTDESEHRGIQAEARMSCASQSAQAAPQPGPPERHLQSPFLHLEARARSDKLISGEVTTAMG